MASGMEQTKALQENLRAWHKTLDQMNFATLKLDTHWVERLNQERAMCVEGIETAKVVTSAQLEEKEPSLMREVILFGVLGRLQVNLISLLDFLNLSYCVRQTNSASTGTPPGSLELQGRVSGMISALQVAYERIQVDVVDRLVLFDKSSASQVEAPISPHGLSPTIDSQPIRPSISS